MKLCTTKSQLIELMPSQRELIETLTKEASAKGRSSFEVYYSHFEIGGLQLLPYSEPQHLTNYIIFEVAI